MFVRLRVINQSYELFEQILEGSRSGRLSSRVLSPFVAILFASACGLHTSTPVYHHIWHVAINYVFIVVEVEHAHC